MNNPGVSRSNPTWRWIAIAVGLAVMATLFVQWRAITRLRGDMESLRAQAQAAADASSQPAAPAAVDAATMEQMQKDRLEVLGLVKELRQLRERELASASAADARPVAAQVAAPDVPGGRDREDEIRQLGLAAMQGEAGAVDKLAQLSAAARTMNTNEQATVRFAIQRAIQRAFEALGTEAGKGNAGALQAVWQATRSRELQGFAVKALGQAAGLGNEEALRPLLEPEKYLLLRSSATSALKPAADAGNERAIQALAATAADPKQQSFWLMAADGLGTAAAAGNATAIDGLATIAAATNRMVSKQAVLWLEAAGRKNQPRAEEALRKLGWR